MGQGDTLDRLDGAGREGAATCACICERTTTLAADPHADRLAAADIQPRRGADDTLPLKLARAAAARCFRSSRGSYSYTAVNARELLHQWVDHPQRLWDAIYETLASGVTTVLHVGPAPNIIPATFRRLSEDVASQMQESRSLRALSAAVRRQWLRRMLPQRAALLRAPYIEHIILEDWLLQMPDNSAAKSQTDFTAVRSRRLVRCCE